MCVCTFDLYIGASATLDADRLKKVVTEVLNSHYASLGCLPKKSLQELANHLFTAHLISNTLRQNPTIEECTDEFKASLNFFKKVPQIQGHCQKFLNSFIAVRGSYAAAAIALHDEWIEAIETKLGFSFNIEIDQ